MNFFTYNQSTIDRPLARRGGAGTFRFGRNASPSLGWIQVVLILTLSACASSTPQLHQDIENDNLEKLRRHIDQGANLSERDDDGQTPLHLALLLEKREIAGELIRRDANINARMRDGSTPLSLAVKKNFADITELLLERKAIIDFHSSGPSPLFDAIRTKNRKMFERLIRGGAQTNRRDYDEQSPLFVASARGHLALVQRLHELGADINAALPDKRTPIHAALGSKHMAVAEWLYAHGAAIGPADGEIGTFTTALVYRFAAEQEYHGKHAARAATYLQRAESAFLSTQALSNDKADMLSSQVTTSQVLNVVSFAAGAAGASANASVSPTGIGTATYTTVSTTSLENLRDQYRNLALRCEREAKQMSTIQACVAADSHFDRACFSTPSK